MAIPVFEKMGFGKLKKIKESLEEKFQEQQKIYGYIGMEAYEMYKQGKEVCQELTVYFEKAEELEKEVQQLESEKQRLELEQQNRKKRVCSCGCSLSPQQKFCTNCGKPVESDVLLCTCGEQIQKEMKFCPSCGRKVSTLFESENPQADTTTKEITYKECICGAKISEGQFMCMECGRKIVD